MMANLTVIKLIIMDKPGKEKSFPVDLKIS